MTPAKLQGLARQAGLLLPHESACGTALTRFAALVRAAVLEEAAQKLERATKRYRLLHAAMNGENLKPCEAAAIVRALAQQAGGEPASRGTIPADRRHDADEKG